MRFILLFFCLIYFFGNCSSQIPAQIFGGNEGIEYNFLWFKDFDTQAKVSFFNFTSFAIDYDDQNQNAYEIYQVAIYNLTKQWGFAGGGRYTGDEFYPLVAVSFQTQTKDLYLNVFPSVQYFMNLREFGYSLFGLLFYQPKINETWKVFTQLTFEPLYGAEGHIYSYQQLRLGLEYKNLIQFGIGANWEQFGRSFALSQNYGLFVRKEF